MGAEMCIRDSRQGERMVICGPSGSGKSTLIRCINRLEQHDSGVITVDGIELNEDTANVAAIRREVGMVFQSFNLFPHLTALQNCTIAQIRVQKKSADEARRMGAVDKADDQVEALFAPQYQTTASPAHRAVWDDSGVPVELFAFDTAPVPSAGSKVMNDSPAVLPRERGGKTPPDTGARAVSLRPPPSDVSPLLRERLFERVRAGGLTSATLAVDDGFPPLRPRLGLQAQHALQLSIKRAVLLFRAPQSRQGGRDGQPRARDYTPVRLAPGLGAPGDVGVGRAPTLLAGGVRSIDSEDRRAGKRQQKREAEYPGGPGATAGDQCPDGTRHEDEVGRQRDDRVAVRKYRLSQ